MSKQTKEPTVLVHPKTKHKVKTAVAVQVNNFKALGYRVVEEPTKPAAKKPASTAAKETKTTK